MLYYGGVCKIHGVLQRSVFNPWCTMEDCVQSMLYYRGVCTIHGVLQSGVYNPWCTIEECTIHGVIQRSVQSMVYYRGVCTIHGVLKRCVYNPWCTTEDCVQSMVYYRGACIICKALKTLFRGKFRVYNHCTITVHFCIICTHLKISQILWTPLVLEGIEESAL